MGLHEHDTQLPSLEVKQKPYYQLSYKPRLPKHLFPGGSVSHLFFAILPCRLSRLTQSLHNILLGGSGERDQTLYLKDGDNSYYHGTKLSLGKSDKK